MRLAFWKRSPKPAERQVPARRSYAAAKQTRLLADWIAPQKTADAILKSQLRTLRARSRDLVRNNDYARRFLGLTKNNVVGPTGVRLQARARDARGDLDKLDNAAIENAWADWGRVGVCTMDGRHDWTGVQQWAIESVARDGELLARHVRGRQAGNVYGYALQLLEPDLLDEDLNDTLKNGNRVVMGVELNAWSRAVAYHLLAEHPGDDTWSRHGRHYRRVPAAEILHAYVAERSSQTRGVPWMATAMTRLQMLGGYEEAELVAARTAAAKMGFFTSPDGEGYAGDDETSTGELISEASPGTFEQLPAGVEFHSFDPQHPTSQFPDFMRAMLRGIASGLGVSYNSLSNDLTSVNYSSIRQGALEERDQWRVLQQWLIAHLCEPVYRAWLDMAITTDQLPMPPRRIGKAASVVWQPRGWQWVDPLKEVNAQLAAIEGGLKSRTEVLAGEGRDFEETVDQLASEAKLAAQAGIPLTKTETGNGQAGNDADPGADAPGDD